MMRTKSFIANAVVLALSVVARPASADEEHEESVSSKTSSDTGERHGTFSLALERFGGIAYAKGSEKDDEDGLSMFTVGLGVGTLNPFAVPRVGADYVLPSGLSFGLGAGAMRWSGSTSSGSRSEDIGSAFLYTASPRVGYRFQLSRRVDLTPRAGLTFAGAVIHSGDDRRSWNAFSLGLGVEAPFVFRVTDSFNILAAPAFDVTVAATLSQARTRGGGSVSSSSDLKGTLFSFQGWLGIGGYLGST